MKPLARCGALLDPSPDELVRGCCWRMSLPPPFPFVRCRGCGLDRPRDRGGCRGAVAVADASGDVEGETRISMLEPSLIDDSHVSAVAAVDVLDVRLIAFGGVTVCCCSSSLPP